MENREKNGYTLHYDREERLKTLSPDIVNRERHGFLKGNRSLIILFIDVFLIIIIAFVLYPLLIEFSSKTRIEDWFIKIKAFEYEDNIYTTLLVIRKNEKVTSSGNLFKINYTINGNEKGELEEVLPDLKDEEKNIRNIINIDEDIGPQTLKVKVTYKNISKYMTLKFSRETE